MNVDDLFMELMERIVKGEGVGENEPLLFNLLVAKRHLELHEESVRAQHLQHTWAVAAQERQNVALERIASALEEWGPGK